MQVKRVFLTTAIVLATTQFAMAGFWDGSWGISRSGIISVAGKSVSYVGNDGKSYPVSNVKMTEQTLSFKAGQATVDMHKANETTIQGTFTLGGRTSPMVLCRSDASHCP